MFKTHCHCKIHDNTSAYHCEWTSVCSDLRCSVNHVYLFQGYDLQLDFRDTARDVLCGKMSWALVRCSSELAKVISWNASTRRYRVSQGVDMFPLHSTPASGWKRSAPVPSASSLILDIQSANAIKTAAIQRNTIQDQSYFKHNLCWVCYGQF